MKRPQPKDYSSLSPYLMVTDVERQVTFLQRAFAATILEKLHSPSGVIWHADLRIGDTVVMIGRAQRAYPATRNSLYIWCHDVDALYAMALRNGGSSVEEPTNQFYGVREAGVLDPHGNTWWIGQEVENLSHSEKEQRIGDIPPEAAG